MLVGCSSTNKIKQETILVDFNQNTTQIENNTSDSIATSLDNGNDNHDYISQTQEIKAPIFTNVNDSLLQNSNGVDANLEDIISPVADRIVENYLKSENKEPDGHCLEVSKDRFEVAYKEVHGHTFYQDLPEIMASKFYTPKQVFNLLYVSASDTKEGWRSLPEAYRGKGNAGALAYAGMGTLVDTKGIWSGQLKPGALLQVWRFKDDYEKVVQGVNVKKLDPYGHSFIFISYVLNDKNEIVGLRIADQGFQSYRPLIPRDYEVWWAVNLSI